MASPYEVRGHITMDMASEKQVFESFVSTLSMCESAPNNQDVTISLTLGQLRQHVQWCQYAALACDGADAVNKEHTRVRTKLLRAERLLQHWNKQEEMLTSIDGRLANLKDSIAQFNKSRGQSQQELREYAKTND